MRKLTKKLFNTLNREQQLKVARLPANRGAMQSTRAMCDPHGNLDEYSGEEWVGLANAAYVIGSKLEGPTPEEFAAIAAANTLQLVATLKAAYPLLQVEVVPKATSAYCDDECAAEELIAVAVEEMTICDPYTSECGRFEMDPTLAYGINYEHAAAIARHNRITHTPPITRLVASTERGVSAIMEDRGYTHQVDFGEVGSSTLVEFVGRDGVFAARVDGKFYECHA